MKRPSRHLLYSVGCALCVVAAVILSSSGSGGQARGAAAPARVSKAELQETIDWFANRNGDHQPGPAEMIETKATEAHFDVGEPADGVDPSFAGADVFLVTMRRHFTGYLAHVPSHAPLPKGTVLTVAVDATTGAIRMWNLSNRLPTLAHSHAPVETIP